MDMMTVVVNDKGRVGRRKEGCEGDDEVKEEGIKNPPNSPRRRAGP
jgi:hypothetical protein